MPFKMHGHRRMYPANTFSLSIKFICPEGEEICESMPCIKGMDKWQDAQDRMRHEYDPIDNVDRSMGKKHTLYVTKS